MKIQKECTLQSANGLFEKKQYKEALNIYRELLINFEYFEDTINFNIYLCLKRLGFNEKAFLKDEIVVYTCNFGRCESVKEIKYKDPTVKYILFTDDKELRSKTWQVIVIDLDELNSRRKSRVPKILAHKYLPKHDISLYIDSSLEIKTADIRYMLIEMLEGKNIALYNHYKRNCVYDEIEFLKESNNNDRAEKDYICNQVLKKYINISYPKDNGLFENAFIIRRNTNEVNDLNDLWWKSYIEGSERDQFSFMYALHLSNLKANSIKIGKQFRINPFVNFFPHGNILNVNSNNQSICDSNKKKIAICVHVFYEDVWADIFKRLNGFNSNEYSLYITGSNKTIANIKPAIDCIGIKNIKFLEVDNSGMDVLPFLEVVKFFELHKYNYVLKLHTKNNKTSQRKTQGDMIFNALINKDVARYISEKTVGNKCSAIYPGLFTRSIKAMVYENHDNFQKFNNVLGLYCDEESTFSAGTMFWIKGEKLKILYESYHILIELFKEPSKKLQTGSDGTVAHAFERILGLLCNEKEKLFSFQIGLNNPQYKLLKNEIFESTFANILCSDSTSHIDNYHNLESAKQLSKHKIFDERFYIDELRLTSFLHSSLSELAPSAHAVLYSEALNCDISENFSMCFYKLSNLDILRKRKSVLAHYILYGEKEGRATFPTYKSIYLLFKKFDIFKSLSISVHKLFNTKKNSEKNISRDDYLLIKDILIDILNTLERHALVVRQINLGGTNTKINLIENHTDNLSLQEAQAFLYLLNNDFNRAFKNYNSFWNNRSNENASVFPTIEKISYRQPSSLNDNIFSHVVPKIQNLLEPIEKRICIYTTIFGNRDDLPTLNTSLRNVDFVCFSDREHESKDWEVIIVDKEFDSDNLNAKRFKVLPHKYLKGYDASLFVDANTFFHGNLDELLKCYLVHEPFVMWKHPERSDLNWEVGAIIAHKRHRPLEVINQIKAYSEMGIPKDTGLAEGSFIWRTHDSVVLNLFMEEWWDHILTFSERDQLSLSFLMWKNNYRPKVLPDYLGNGRSNIYFSKFSHKNTSNITTSSIVIPKKKMVFLYRDKFIKSGSTVMRGEQLYTMVKNHFKVTSNKNVEVIFSSNPNSINNSVIFATKGFLSTTTHAELQKLIKQGNLILADYVDAKINTEFIKYFEIIIAASISAYINYKVRFPNKNIELITHHVDPRIEKLCTRGVRKNNEIAYFGELVNTKITESAKQYIKFYNVDTSGKEIESSWINQVDKFEYHYAVRRKRGIDGFKPFTKGFTAACSGSKVILDKNVDDSTYYLGFHYPFFIKYDDYIDATLNQILEFRTINGNIDIKLAECYIDLLRARSNPEYILGEFTSIVSKYFN